MTQKGRAKIEYFFMHLATCLCCLDFFYFSFYSSLEVSPWHDDKVVCSIVTKASWIWVFETASMMVMLHISNSDDVGQ